MKHCILAKYRPEVYPRRQELLPRIRQIFSAASELEGVSGASVYPNCVARDNRYDVLIVLDMAPEALPVCWRRRPSLILKRNAPADTYRTERLLLFRAVSFFDGFLCRLVL